jgi:hypothetical protein
MYCTVLGFDAAEDGVRDTGGELHYTYRYGTMQLFRT